MFDWKSVQHAYGPATEVPSWLRTIAKERKRDLTILLGDLASRCAFDVIVAGDEHPPRIYLRGAWQWHESSARRARIPRAPRSSTYALKRSKGESAILDLFSEHRHPIALARSRASYA